MKQREIRLHELEAAACRRKEKREIVVEITRSVTPLNVKSWAAAVARLAIQLEGVRVSADVAEPSRKAIP